MSEKDEEPPVDPRFHDAHEKHCSYCQNSCDSYKEWPEIVTRDGIVYYRDHTITDLNDPGEAQVNFDVYFSTGLDIGFDIAQQRATSLMQHLAATIESAAAMDLTADEWKLWAESVIGELRAKGHVAQVTRPLNLCLHELIIDDQGIARCKRCGCLYTESR